MTKENDFHVLIQIINKYNLIRHYLHLCCQEQTLVTSSSPPPSVSRLPVAHGQTQPPKVSLATGIHGPAARLSGPFQRLPTGNKNTLNQEVHSLLRLWSAGSPSSSLTWQRDEGLTLHPSGQQAVNDRQSVLLLEPGEQRHQLGHWGLWTQVLHTQHLQRDKDHV